MPTETKNMNWTTLNDALRAATEQDAQSMLKQERKTANRPTFILRIYSKYTILRKQRELSELLQGRN